MPGTADIPSNISSWQLSLRLLRTYVWQHKKRIVFGVSCMIIAAIATAGNAWMMQPVLDDIFVNKDQKLLIIVPIIVLIVNVLKGAAGYGQSVTMKYIGQRVVTDMQLDLYDHLLHADLATFNDQSSGKLISRFSNDIHIVRKNLTHVLVGFVKETITVICLLGVMFYQSAELAMIAFFIFPLAIYPVILLGKRMRKVSDATQEELGHFTAGLDDTFQGIRVVKAYCNEDHEVERARTIVEKIFQLYYKAARIESASSPIMESLIGIIIAAVIWYGGAQVLDGETTPGAFFSFMAALIMAYKPIKSLAGINTNLQEGLAAVKRFFSILDTPANIQSKEDAPALDISDSTIEFKDVSFSYDQEKLALKDLSLTIPAGKRVALVGASGGGKSTIMNLILRFYDPDKGAVLINGQDLRDISLSSLRNHMAIVTQETTLFDDTVRANLCYGRKDADEESIIQATYNAAAHDFISELSEGDQTLIGPHGMRLSGGQRQRIAIARAMLRDAPILLLDEATSALDTVSEKQVQKALDELMKDRTTLVIAHRLSTIINADIIYVVKKGKIIESGGHEELLQSSKEYNRLYKANFSQ